MSDHPVGDGRDDRPPSARARAELSSGVASGVADARLRLQEAVLRAEGHRLLGDQQGLQAALADQQRILDDLEVRLGRAVSAAVLQRDAEEVVAAAVADVPDFAPADDVRLVTLDDEPDAAAPRHAPLLSGVASIVALVALAGAIVLGSGQGPNSPTVLEIAGQLDEVEQPDAPTDPTAWAAPDGAPRVATEGAADRTTTSGPTERARTTDAPAGEQAAEGDDADARPLERIVEELNEVVTRFELDRRLDLRVRGDEDGTQAEEGDGTDPADDPADDGANPDQDADDTADTDEDADDADGDEGGGLFDGFVRGDGDE